MTGSDTASRARSLTTDLGGEPTEATTGIPVGGPAGPLPMVSALPPKKELPTCFEVKARILDFYPITLDEEGCLLRVCGDCKNLSVPCLIFLRLSILNSFLKDRENCGVVPRLFESNTPSSRGVPLLTFVHVGHGKRRTARCGSWKY